MAADPLATWLGHVARKSGGALAGEHIDAPAGDRIVGAGIRLPVKPTSTAEYDALYLDHVAPTIECYDAVAAGSSRCAHYGGTDECPPAAPAPWRRCEPDHEPAPEPSPTPEPEQTAERFGGCKAEKPRQSFLSRGWRIVRG